MPTDLTNDELIGVPLANLQPGELRRAFQVQAAAAEKNQETENERLRSFSALQRGREEETNHEHEELERREAILLAGLQEREREIIEEAAELDRRTIKLDDGRRAYVDGNRFRDAEGRELHGADRASAEQHHLDQPNAATWQEHQDVERRWQTTEQLKQKVETLQAEGGTDSGKTLSNYEAEYETRIAKRESKAPAAPSYGGGDYMAALGGLSGDFRQATTAPAGTDPSAKPTLTPLRTPSTVAALTA